MPGFYADGEYDLAGFIVGIVDRDRLITGKDIQPGDVLVGLPSTGLHTNGYSLARKLIFETAGHKPGDRVPALKEKAGVALMKVHRSYLPAIRQLTRRGVVAGMAHITGGGITENLPRILPKNISAEIDLVSWPVPPLFRYLQQLGDVPQDEMLRTFNMGIGLIAVVPQSKWKLTQSLLGRLGERFYVVGQTVKGDRSVCYRA
jgi:phosphoribosylformylglycinamidine cyclo-ligase